jgi:hypothetical protein
MKQFVVRIFVALTMCGLTSVIRLGILLVISPAPGAEAIWVFRLILTGVFSPLLYGFLVRRLNLDQAKRGPAWLARKSDQRNPLGTSNST